MKNQIVKSFVAISFLVLFCSVSAYTQVHSRVLANIPFDFFVKSQKFPAGVYELSSLNPTSGPTDLLIKRKDGTASRAVVMLLPMVIDRKQARSSPVLTFNRYGSTYFLSELRNGMENFGAHVPKTKQERNLAKLMGEAKRESVALSNQR